MAAILTSGLLLRPDATPTSGTMTTSAKLIDSVKYTTQLFEDRTGTYSGQWIDTDSYGFDFGSSKRICVIDFFNTLPTHLGSPVGWRTDVTSREPFTLHTYVSDDNSAWTYVQEDTYPEITYLAAGKLSFRLTITSPVYGRYVKVQIAEEAAFAFTFSNGSSFGYINEVEAWTMDFIGVLDMPLPEGLPAYIAASAVLDMPLPIMWENTATAILDMPMPDVFGQELITGSAILELPLPEMYAYEGGQALLDMPLPEIFCELFTVNIAVAVLDMPTLEMVTDPAVHGTTPLPEILAVFDILPDITAVLDPKLPEILGVFHKVIFGIGILDLPLAEVEGISLTNSMVSILEMPLVEIKTSYVFSPTDLVDGIALLGTEQVTLEYYNAF